MNCYLDKSSNPIGIQDKRNKTKKNDYAVDGIVFYDGEKEMFENFVLSYAPDYWERPAVGSVRQLPEHEDDSDITINLCLGGDFSESSVIFDNGIEYKNKVGSGIIHPGNAKHRVTSCNGE